MNVARVAELLRELADELEAESAESKPAQPAKARPRLRSFPAPLKPVSDTDMMAARKMLRRRGIG